MRLSMCIDVDDNGCESVVAIPEKTSMVMTSKPEMYSMRPPKLTANHVCRASVNQLAIIR